MVLKTVLARFERFFLMIIVILANFINSHYRLDSYFIYVILLTVFVIIRTIMRNSEILDTVNMIFDPLWAWCRYWQYKIYRHQGIFQTDQNFGFYGHFNLRGNKKHHVYKLSNGLSNLLHFSHVQYSFQRLCFCIFSNQGTSTNRFRIFSEFSAKNLPPSPSY